jgi:hypothetical protein
MSLPPGEYFQRLFCARHGILLIEVEVAIKRSPGNDVSGIKIPFYVESIPELTGFNPQKMKDAVTFFFICPP